VLFRRELLHSALGVERGDQPRREGLQVVDEGDGGEVDGTLVVVLRPRLVGGRAGVDEQVQQLAGAVGVRRIGVGEEAGVPRRVLGAPPDAEGVSLIENAGWWRQAANSAGTVSVSPGQGRGERKAQGLIADSCANPLRKAPSGVKATR
jgi:hypothetical protein